MIYLSDIEDISSFKRGKDKKPRKRRRINPIIPTIGLAAALAEARGFLIPRISSRAKLAGNRKARKKILDTYRQSSGMDKIALKNRLLKLRKERSVLKGTIKGKFPFVNVAVGTTLGVASGILIDKAVKRINQDD